MKKRFLNAALFTASLCGAVARPLADEAIKFSPVANTAFRPGEKLTFVIKYEFIGAGTATLEVQEGPAVAGRPTHYLISHAKSSDFIDVFFKVRDFNASVIDKESLVSFSFHQNLREGHYRVVRNTSFDYAGRIYTFEKEYKGKTRHETGPLPELVSDMLSSFFTTRALALERGKDYEIRVFSDGKIIPLLVKVHPDLHQVRVPAGKFTCLRVQPFITGDAIFQVKEGKMLIWLTDDDRRVPVLIRSKVAVGAFDAELTKHELPN